MESCSGHLTNLRERLTRRFGVEFDVQRSDLSWCLFRRLCPEIEIEIHGFDNGGEYKKNGRVYINGTRPWVNLAQLDAHSDEALYDTLNFLFRLPLSALRAVREEAVYGSVSSKARPHGTDR